MSERARRHAVTRAISLADGVRPEGQHLPPSRPGAGHNTSESRMNRIARRAQEIYEARGGEHGRALDDWLQAEREIDAASVDPRKPDE